MKSSTLLTAVLSLTVASSAFAGPVIYFFDGDSSTGLIVNTNTSSFTTFSTFNHAYPVAIVGNSIVLQGRDDASATGGATYDLNGNFTGSIPGQDAAVSQLLDGTTDGITNYAVQCCSDTNSVWAASLTWQNFTPLFSLPEGESGITYDSANNSLYLVDFAGTLFQYSLTGTLLNTYAGDSGIESGLSYDSATDTLWGTINHSDSVVQETTTGTVLQTLTVTGLSGFNIYGGEIAAGGSAVPEPGTTMLVGAALLAVGLISKRAIR
jgi:hypothetical protein